LGEAQDLSDDYTQITSNASMLSSFYHSHVAKVISSERPFTPPFQTIDQLQGHKKSQLKLNNKALPLVSGSGPGMGSGASDKPLVSLVYDYVLKCYYDQASELYFELKK